MVWIIRRLIEYAFERRRVLSRPVHCRAIVYGRQFFQQGFLSGLIFVVLVNDDQRRQLCIAFSHIEKKMVDAG
jgi:hypothetical protein